MAVGILRSLTGAAMVLGAGPAIGQAPPPPPPIVEFFHPTPHEHSVTAECYGGGGAALAWRFDGQDTILHTFTFGGRSLSPAQMAQMQSWMSEIGGDILIDIECTRDAAGLRLINAQFAGSAGARGIRATLLKGTLSEFARYHFDGQPISHSPEGRAGVR